MKKEPALEKIEAFNTDPNNFYKNRSYCFNCKSYFTIKIPKGKTWEEALGESIIVCSCCGNIKKRKARWYHFSNSGAYCH